MAKRRVILGLSVVAFASVAFSGSDIPTCDSVPSVLATWQAAWDALGILPAPSDPGLGDTAAKRWFGSSNWYPVDGTNEVLCGKLRDWSEFNGAPATLHEFDVHPHISPAEAFGFLFSDLPDYSQFNTEGCTGVTSQPCIWGEATPPAARRESLYGGDTVEAIQHQFVGHPVCVYGPWETESVHGFLPEIHPYRELWMSSDDASSKMRLVLVRDSSDRFERAGDFAVIGPRPTVVWSPQALDETFGVAYQLENGQASDLSFRVSPDDGQPLRKVTHDFGPSSVQLELPSTLQSSSFQVCRAAEHGHPVIRGIDWIHATATPAPDQPDYEGAAVAFDVTRFGGDPLSTSALLRPALQRGRTFVAGRRQEEQAPPNTSHPVLRMRIIGVDSEPATSEDVDLPHLATVFWKLKSGPVPSWNASPEIRIRLMPYYAAGDLGEKAADDLNDGLLNGKGPHVTISWKATADGLDNAPSGVGVAGTNADYFFGVDFQGGSSLTTHVPVSKRQLKTAARPGLGVEQWEEEVHVSLPTATMLSQNPTSGVLHLAARLADDHGARSDIDFTLDVPTHVPAVDIHPGAEPSDAFLQLVATWLHANRPTLTVTDQVLKTSLVADSQPQPDHLTANDEVRRRARIFRMRYLRAVEDGDCDAQELNEVLASAGNWADAKWPNNAAKRR